MTILMYEEVQYIDFTSLHFSTHRAEIYEVEALADELLATDNFAGRLCLFPLVLRPMVDCSCSSGWFHSHVHKINTNRIHWTLNRVNAVGRGRGCGIRKESEIRGKALIKNILYAWMEFSSNQLKKTLALVISTACVYYWTLIPYSVIFPSNG